MEFENSPFKSIIKSQIKNKRHLIKKESPPPNGISLTIINGSVKHSKCSGNTHQKRKKQIIGLFQDVVKNYKVKNCYVNINLEKTPIDNYFNFYRLKNNDKQFLLPNPRFYYDNVLLDKKEKKYNTFDDLKKALREKDNTFNEKLNKIYINCNSSKTKLKLFKKISHINKKEHIIDSYMCIGDSHKINNIPSIDPSLNKIKYFVKKKMAGFGYKYFEEHCKYKYILNDPYYINTDKIRLLLNIECIPLTKNSNYENFYTHTIVNKVNHIEFSNYQEIQSIYHELENNTNLCNNIIKNNKTYCEEILTYDNILEYIAILINNVC